MLSFLKKDPVKKAEKLYKSKLTEAMNAQRSGDIQAFAHLTQEADVLLKEIEVLKNKK